MVASHKIIVIISLIIVLLGLIASVPFIVAQGSGQAEDSGLAIKYRAVCVIIIAGIISSAIVIVSILIPKKSEIVKWVLFLSICIPIITATVYSGASTIYTNFKSISHGPVHWHADFELWDCGKKIDIIDPHGLSNRIGSPVFHEHADDRIHLEGVLMDEGDAELQHFFSLIGGELTEEKIVVPTSSSQLIRLNGDKCDGKPGKLQVFRFSSTGSGSQTYIQEKLGDFPHYRLAPFTSVPPGDCIIIEFDSDKEKTDRICSSYRLALAQGERHGS